MNARAVQCARCRQPLREAALRGDYARCPNCRAEQKLRVFPALVREPAGAAAENVGLAPDESACFYHEQKKAVVSCDNCGRFLCPLCDVAVEARHLCPSCLDSQAQKGKLNSFERGRFLSQQVAIRLAVLNLLIGWCLLGLPGLAAVGFGVHAWFGPKAVYQRGKLSDRLYAGTAIVLGLGGVIGMILVVIGLVNS